MVVAEASVEAEGVDAYVDGGDEHVGVSVGGRTAAGTKAEYVERIEEEFVSAWRIVVENELVDDARGVVLDVVAGVP